MALKLVSCPDLLNPDYDGVVFVNDDISSLGDKFEFIEKALLAFSKIHLNLKSEICVIPFPEHPSNRLIFSPTNRLNRDMDDSRNVYDAASAGFKKAVCIGCKKPLLVLGPLSSAPSDVAWASEPYRSINAILGADYALYTPIEVRESSHQRYSKVDIYGIFGVSVDICKAAFAIAEGRRVARDIGGSDPERMAAPKVVEYLEHELSSLDTVSITVNQIDEKKHPLMAAVNRAASGVERHNGRIVYLTYTPPSGTKDVDTSLFLVGKGITYDTGGTDVKAGGVMAGMHRDKCGAAAVCGLFKTLGLTKPSGISVTAACAFVRNSIGSNGYVADEIILSRAGKRVRVGNTDAEGRMVMADLLCELKDKAIEAHNPFLFTVATLTGHVVRAYKDYAAVMDNGPARKINVSKKLQEAGDRISDPIEISTIRKEDYAFHAGQTEYEDILQCNNLPSSATPRGHQTPAAFLILASGLDAHGIDSSKPLPYTHVDCAGSAASIHVLPTASPLTMLTSCYIIPRLAL